MRRPQPERADACQAAATWSCPTRFELAAVEAELAGFDACFFCLGVSSVGMSETGLPARDLRPHAGGGARLLVRLNPQMTFVYVTGARHRQHRARPRACGRGSRARPRTRCCRLPFKAAYMFRPGIIQPLHGVRSKTALYRWAYVGRQPACWARAPAGWRRYGITTSEQVGRAMLVVAKRGAPQSAASRWRTSTRCARSARRQAARKSRSAKQHLVGRLGHQLRGRPAPCTTFGRRRLAAPASWRPRRRHLVGFAEQEQQVGIAPPPSPPRRWRSRCRR